jgi:hypothetical protein
MLSNNEFILDEIKGTKTNVWRRYLTEKSILSEAHSMGQEYFELGFEFSITEAYFS